MKKYNKGFIQIPLLIAIVIGFFTIGEISYIGVEKYKDIKTKKEIFQDEKIISTDKISTTTTNNLVKKNVSEKESIINKIIKSEIEPQKEQVQLETEKQKKEEVKNTIVTLPNGSVLELNEYGNIIKTIKEAPQTVNQDNGLSISNKQHVATGENTPKIEVTLESIDINSDFVSIKWTTNLPTDSKIFLDSPLEPTKMINSMSGKSTKHLVNLEKLKNGTLYNYTIEAINNSQDEKIYGSFNTKNQSLSITNFPKDNDVPHINFYSDKPFTIQKLVFRNDDSYCNNNGYVIMSLSPQYKLSEHSSISPKDIRRDSNNYFVLDYVKNNFSTYGENVKFDLNGAHVSAKSNALIRISHGDGQPTESNCVKTGKGVKLTFVSNDSLILDEYGKKIELGNNIDIFGE